MWSKKRIVAFRVMTFFFSFFLFLILLMACAWPSVERDVTPVPVPDDWLFSDGESPTDSGIFPLELYDDDFHLEYPLDEPLAMLPPRSHFVDLIPANAGLLPRTVSVKIVPKGTCALLLMMPVFIFPCCSSIQATLDRRR